MIIATAGHVDHGKTILVKALTGVDTDTLEEEKRRGLTINLGFAYLAVADQPAIGFIDVPGHTRFIRNALCGLAATDFVLLVVAADDGPMAQTREHLAIIDLLDCPQVALVVTKIDRVSSQRVSAVCDQVQQMLVGAGLKHAPCFAVSATSGQGIDALRRHLLEMQRALGQNEDVTPPGEKFRLAVDRAFHVKGTGLVVTGTIFAGTVAVGDAVDVCGETMRLRVRGLRVQNEQAERGHQGQRCALNLAGPELRSPGILPRLLDCCTGRRRTGVSLRRFIAHNPAVRASIRTLDPGSPASRCVGYHCQGCRSGRQADCAWRDGAGPDRCQRTARRCIWRSVYRS